MPIADNDNRSAVYNLYLLMYDSWPFPISNDISNPRNGSLFERSITL
jgi:hypothetical protein